MVCLNIGGGFSISEGRTAAAWHPGTQIALCKVGGEDGWLLLGGQSLFHTYFHLPECGWPRVKEKVQDL